MIRRPHGNTCKGDELVPGAPFSNWLQGLYDEEKARGGSFAVRLAIKVGVCPEQPSKAQAEAAARHLYRLRKGRLETVRDGQAVVLPAVTYARRFVEEICEHFAEGQFERLYPAYGAALGDPLDDVTLEPDAWCPYCKQNVTPIDGLCPWCMCEHGHIFREVGFTEKGFACLQCAKFGRRRSAMSADSLAAAFEGDGVTDEMVERLKDGQPPIPLTRPQCYEQAVRMHESGVPSPSIAKIMKAYHGVDRSPETWRRIVRVWGKQEAA